jgi:hypothetical protein
MFLPLLSVSFIGVAIGGLFAALSRPHGSDALLHALIGAWLGFLAGAVAGLLGGTAAAVATAGNLGAATGAVIASIKARRSVTARAAAPRA